MKSRKLLRCSGSSHALAGPCWALAAKALHCSLRGSGFRFKLLLRFGVQDIFGWMFLSPVVVEVWSYAYLTLSDLFWPPTLFWCSRGELRGAPWVCQLGRLDRKKWCHALICRPCTTTKYHQTPVHDVRLQAPMFGFGTSWASAQMVYRRIVFWGVVVSSEVAWTWNLCPGCLCFLSALRQPARPDRKLGF